MFICKATPLEKFWNILSNKLKSIDSEVGLEEKEIGMQKRITEIILIIQ